MADLPEAYYRIEAFPEYVELKQKLELTGLTGVQNPYFTVHEGVAGDTTIVGGRELLNYSTANYLGLSGHPEVVKAAQEAVARYGTSVSASRIASGEKPLHGELERRIAQFLGTEAALVLSGGHATNVTVIGHLLEPGDLVLHDAMAHESVLQGAKLSGAERRPFPHNDLAALDRILSELRPRSRRVLVVIEGVYGIDGDLPDLPPFIALREKHKVFLMIDEAHSIGVLGARGRGIGEHCSVARESVDIWMGTLSKSLASGGGYIAGSKALIEFMKYTAPGFVFTAGLTPANTAAALAAIEVLDREPERVRALHARADLFRGLARGAGLEIGSSRHSGMIPVVIGSSFLSMTVAERLALRGINVQPVIYPAVPDEEARLRFFVSAIHTEDQIRTTVRAVAETLARARAEAP